jgi:DNA segregation ATPase FtsK/SpoIIIE, S-DNA-T family
MANKSKNDGTRDAVAGIFLLGIGILLPVALYTYNPADIPDWIPLISTTSVEPGHVHNLVGIVGAIVAGYLFFLFGVAAWLWMIVCVGYGLAKLTLPRFPVVLRMGWSFMMVVSGAAIIQIQPWFFKDLSRNMGLEGAGGFVGKWVGEKAFIGSLGEVGAPVVLVAIYLASMVLAIGFHPVHVAASAWAKLTAYLAARRALRMAALEETERMELERRELAKRATKLEKQSRKAAPKDSPESPPAAAAGEEPKIIDASAPPEKRPTLAEIEAARRGPVPEGEKPALAGLKLENYELPPLDLLDEAEESDRGPADYESLRITQQTILETLVEFGIEATAGDITFGPTITRYEVKPVRGVRVDRIASLERDIARATRAPRINILAPIPGKDTVGIELANPKKVKVTLRELLETEEWLHGNNKLPLALGKDVYGKPIIADLAKMPHCLVAGTTGSGKSVCINSIIASLLYRYTPEDLRFIMIDPKVVEMQIYNRLPHLVTPVVTESKKVLMALKWVVDEMELRYKIFAKVGVRNVTGFNNRPNPRASAKSSDASDEETTPLPEDRDAPPFSDPSDATTDQGLAETENPDPSGEAAAPTPESAELSDLLNASDESADEAQMNEVGDEVPGNTPPIRNARDGDLIIPERMPAIVVIIDELADLMQTAPADVEGSIARITQMARAAGIHVIIATQTPRADVVTGIIKANIPTRIAFQVASGLDSRVILDQKGAEKLLGQGDMMYLPPGSSELIRSQGVLVTEEEINRLVDFVASQAEPNFEPSIHEKLQSDAEPEQDVTEQEEELIEKFIEIMKQERRASTSMFQRRLRLGYARAARIVDLMEQRGLIGPVNGNRDREILVDLESL